MAGSLPVRKLVPKRKQPYQAFNSNEEYNHLQHNRDRVMAHPPAEVIDLDEDDKPRWVFIPDSDDEDLDGNDDSDDEVEFFAAPPRRSVQADQPHHRLTEFTNRAGLPIVKGGNYELSDGDFVRVRDIVSNDSSRAVTLKVNRIRRNYRLHRMLPKKLNEVSVVLRVPQGVANPGLNEYPDTVTPDEVVVRRDIIFTNCAFRGWKGSDLSFRETFMQRYGTYVWERKYETTVAESDVLVARCKFVEYYNQAGKPVKEGAIIGLREDEADAGKSVSDVLKGRNWHGSPELQQAAGVKSASNVEHRTPPKFENLDGPSNSRGIATIDLTNDDDAVEEIDEYTFKRVRRTDRLGTSIHEQWTSRRSESVCLTSRPKLPVCKSPTRRSTSGILQYPYGDICSGAGGMASGAHKNGFRVAFTVDKWKEAVETTERNWPNAVNKEWDIHRFCVEPGLFNWMRVTVLHISFPCQTYSGAHRDIEGKDDDANSAAGYSVLDIFPRSRPRVVTFEQTSGLLERHRDSFAALIHQITSMQFNVRWKIIKADAQGNYQKRKRLILIASCPGEPLPPFPAPTHGPGLKPFPTINDALAVAARGHVEQHMQEHTKVKNGMSYDGNVQLRHAITTGGGQSNLHPNGERTFTCQELAILQGFDRGHRFARTNKTNLRKLIGNAVPSMLAEAIFKEVKKSLTEWDMVMADYKPPVVALDDD